ncbi:MAG: hypothetical protein ACTHOP_17380 [Mesorhizobium sp.]
MPRGFEIGKPGFLLVHFSDDAEDFVHPPQQLVLKKNDIAFDFADIPFDASETGLMPQQNLGHGSELLLYTPQIRERMVGNLSRCHRLGVIIHEMEDSIL